MKFLQKLRQAKLEYALEGASNLLIEIKWLIPNITYKVCKFVRKVCKVFKYTLVIWHDEDWDQAYMLYLLRHKLVNMKEYLRNGVLASQEQRDLTIQINQTLDHIENYLHPDEKFVEMYGKCPVEVSMDFEPTDETGKWYKPVLKNEETGEELTEREDLLYTQHVMKQHTFEQNEWDAIWDTIKKYGQGWWD